MSVQLGTQPAGRKAGARLRPGGGPGSRLSGGAGRRGAARLGCVELLLLHAERRVRLCACVMGAGPAELGCREESSPAPIRAVRSLLSVAAVCLHPSMGKVVRKSATKAKKLGKFRSP